MTTFCLAETQIFYRNILLKLVCTVDFACSLCVSICPFTWDMHFGDITKVFKIDIRCVVSTMFVSPTTSITFQLTNGELL